MERTTILAGRHHGGVQLAPRTIPGVLVGCRSVPALLRPGRRRGL